MEHRMRQKKQQRPLRERLLEAGVEELQRYGFENFSVRRIASQCGVSCAAPYKHFADKQTFISAIFEYINKQWILRQNVVLQNCQGPTRKKILEFSMEYVRFLVEHAQFRSIIMMKYDDTDEKFSTLRHKLTRQTYILVHRYCKEVDMPPEVRHRKLFVVRSLIYGAALMFDNGELEYTEENVQMVARCIDREFDLP